MDTSFRILQIQKESEAWKRSLVFLIQENTYLKLQLAELLNNQGEYDHFLEAAEDYQNRFIQKDEIIRLIQQDISQLDKLLLRDLDGDGVTLKEILFRQKKYRKE